MIDLAKKRRIRRHPPLVILCDISGSMERYSRMLLHFMHAATNDRDRVYSFVFGTRITNITRQLRQRDADVALAKVGDVVQDWSGGTRIGHCLHEFNRVWSRRVLAQGAVVLLITDGLDRDAGEGLEREMERLHKSCRRLIWLNPLLRWEGYAPLAAGSRAIIKHVDDFRRPQPRASPTSRPPPASARAAKPHHLAGHGTGRAAQRPPKHSRGRHRPEPQGSDHQWLRPLQRPGLVRCHQPRCRSRL
jgi:uncharacterized protein with von Willebrand factor type A (vWA) domain